VALVGALWEPLRQDRAGKTRQLGGLMDLFFGLFSEAGTWSAAEIAGWCKGAGLQPRKPKRMWFGPDLALLMARKSRGDQTPLELFLAGIAAWQLHVGRLVMQG
jgi:hypothetical protein